MNYFEQQIQSIIDHKTKPVGSLGELEVIAFQIAKVQQSLTPRLCLPTVLVFAGDHGTANAGISCFPQEVTSQMVLNFLDGGAAINVFSKTNGLDLKIIDAGVNFDFPATECLINAKVAKGTKNYLQQPAMTDEELKACFDHGHEIIQTLSKSGCNIVGFGEMGIGNTASASLIMSRICNIPIEKCTGRGAGLDDQQLESKIALLQSATAQHPNTDDPLDCLKAFGGYEIAMMTASMLEGFKQNMILMVDGFISSAAYLIAEKMNPAISANAIFSHQSDEHGHKMMMEYIGASPLLKLSMRLGEGSGCALVYPIIENAVAFFNEMASFESANVSTQV